VLARTGILKGKESTIFKTPDILKEIKGHETVYLDVVISCRVVQGEILIVQQLSEKSYLLPWKKCSFKN
jgi:protease I